MRAYIINLDSATDRWSHMQRAFLETGFEPVRVPAINGGAIKFPSASFDDARYRRLHGRMANPYEVGCYLSHLKALTAFLVTGEEHALICEDDVVADAGIAEVLAECLQYAPHWNVLRVAGLSTGNAMKIAGLRGNRSLCVNVGRMKGAGAYVVDRAAASAFVEKLLPMWLPYDHAFDREWRYGLRCLSILPFPISQTDRLFRSSIQKASGARLPRLGRWLHTYPYQVANETARWFHRLLQFTTLSFHFATGGTRILPPQTPPQDAALI